MEEERVHQSYEKSCAESFSRGALGCKAPSNTPEQNKVLMTQGSCGRQTTRSIKWTNQNTFKFHLQ